MQVKFKLQKQELEYAIGIMHNLYLVVIITNLHRYLLRYMSSCFESFNRLIHKEYYIFFYKNDNYKLYFIQFNVKQFIWFPHFDQ